MRTLAALLLAFAVACDEHDNPEPFVTTDGYSVTWRDRGTFKTDYKPKAQVWGEFDAAMKLAAIKVEQDFGISQGAAIGAAHFIEHIVWDHIFFQTTAGPAVGSYMPTRTPVINVAYWTFGIGVDEADARLLAEVPWTVYQGTKTGNWYYGFWSVDGLGSRLAHEIAHHFGRHHKAGACLACEFKD